VIDVPETVLLAEKADEASFGHELKVLAAVKLYELGRLTSGRAAELAGCRAWSSSPKTAQGRTFHFTETKPRPRSSVYCSSARTTAPRWLVWRILRSKELKSFGCGSFRTAGSLIEPALRRLDAGHELEQIRELQRGIGAAFVPPLGATIKLLNGAPA
jgi:hypothetical protein